MKKALIVLLAVTLMAGYVIAQDEAKPAPSIGVNSWGRVFYVPYASSGISGQDPYVTTGPSWASGGRVSVRFYSQNSDKFGFGVHFDSNGASGPVIGDEAKVWAKPFDMLTIQLGKIQGDVLRGKIGDSGAVQVASSGEDNIFARFYPTHGMLVELRPAEGFYIGAALDAPAGAATGVQKDYFAAIQIGAGYTIAGLGQIRAQYIGGSDSTPVVGNAGKPMQVAFAFTGMEGLLIDAGLTFQTKSDVAKNVFAVGATYGGIENVSLKARLDTAFGKDATNDKTDIAFFTDDSIVIADPMSVGAQASFSGLAAEAKEFQLYPYLKFNCGPGFVQFGALVSIGLESSAPLNATAFAIPVLMEYYF